MSGGYHSCTVDNDSAASGMTYRVDRGACFSFDFCDAMHYAHAQSMTSPQLCIAQHTVPY